jgi:hypothetical protein
MDGGEGDESDSDFMRCLRGWTRRTVAMVVTPTRDGVNHAPEASRRYVAPITIDRWRKAMSSGNETWDARLFGRDRKPVTTAQKILIAALPPTPAEKQAEEKRRKAAKRAEAAEAHRAWSNMRENTWKQRPHFLALLPIAEDEHHYWVRVDRNGNMKFDHIDMYGLVDAPAKSYASTNTLFGKNDSPITETWFAESSGPRRTWATIFTHNNSGIDERAEKNPIRYGKCDCASDFGYLSGNRHRINLCSIVGYSTLAPDDRHPGNRLYDDLVRDVANRAAYLEDARARFTKYQEHLIEVRRRREQRKAERAARKTKE